MSDILFGRYFTLFEVLVDLLLVLLACGIVGVAVYLVVRRLRHGNQKAMRRDRRKVNQSPMASIPRCQSTIC